MRPVLARLPSCAILDGGVGTELIARGMRPGTDCPEAWNVDRPGEVRDLHSAYFLAGADVVQTNTFGANRLRLAAFGLSAEVRAFNMAAALHAREARPAARRDALVVGDLGPTGAVPPPEGKADLIELEDCFAEQAMYLAEGGVDLLHVETMYHPKEARAALRGAHEGAPGLARVASMTCLRAQSGYTTPLGFSPDAMLSVFLEEGVDAVGVNCTLAPADMLQLIRLIRARTSLPIWAKPTASPSTVTPSGSPAISPADMASTSLALYAAGATAVGGCCGAGPAHIAALRAALSGPAIAPALEKTR